MLFDFVAFCGSISHAADGGSIGDIRLKGHLGERLDVMSERNQRGHIPTNKSKRENHELQ